MPTTHTTLLEILSRPVTGDASQIQDVEELIAHPVSIDTKNRAHISEKGTPDSAEATPEEIKTGERIYHEALAYIKDAIAPAMVKVSPHDIQVNDTFCKTLFTYAYPDFLE